MFGLGNADIIAEMYRKELEREAQIHRLLKEARSNKPGLFDTVLAWVGKQMIIVGKRLQKPHMHSHNPVCQQLNISTCC